MKFWKKMMCIFSSALLALATLSFAGCGEEPIDTTNWIPTFSRAEVVGSFICKNDTFGNDTVNRFEIGGTDLGISINVYGKKPKTLLLFGDTFLTESCMGNWRSGVIGLSTDYKLSDGLKLDSFWSEGGFKANAPAESPLDSLHETAYGEETKIYTGGICINNTIYAFYVSRISVSNSTQRADSNNYGGCIKSTDGGTTWQRVWDLTWVDHVEGNGHPLYGSGQNVGTNANIIQNLINMDIDGKRGVGELNIDDREGYFFTQIYPVNGNDGYVYIFGRGGYRTSGIKLGRVKVENFEQFNEYEYLEGWDGQDNPVWTKTIDDAVFLIDEALSNMSVVYNKYVNKWVMSYLDCSDGSGNPIVLRYCSDIAGYWSGKIILLENGGQTTNLYGGYLNDLWVENNGETYYFVFSRWRKADTIYRSYIAKATVSRTAPEATN